MAPVLLIFSSVPCWAAAVPALDPGALAGLRFEPIARGDHPVFDLALDAARAGGTAPCAFSAADEAAVQAFLDGAIPLGGVPDAIARVLDAHAAATVESVEQLETVDAWARATVRDATVRA